MPRVRPDDFYELRPSHKDGVVWARWWRHRDGTVASQHYSNDGSRVIGTFRTGRDFPRQREDQTDG